MSSNFWLYVHCTLYSVHCTVYSTLYSVQYTVQYLLPVKFCIGILAQVL